MDHLTAHSLDGPLLTFSLDNRVGSEKARQHEARQTTTKPSQFTLTARQFSFGRAHTLATAVAIGSTRMSSSIPESLGRTPAVDASFPTENGRTRRPCGAGTPRTCAGGRRPSVRDLRGWWWCAARRSRMLFRGPPLRAAANRHRREVALVMAGGADPERTVATGSAGAAAGGEGTR